MIRVTILGRTNIGKSTLFNRLSPRAKSITYEQVGVTRDYICQVVEWKGQRFELVDSAGLSFVKSADPLQDKVRLMALDLLDSSHIIIFMVDASVGLLPEDHEIAKAIHKSGKPTIVVANKIDVSGAQEHIYECERLGFSSVITLSAAHGTATHELLDALVALLEHTPAPPEEQKPAFSVVLLGKPNVGKSSLLNALVAQERVLVTDIPGTTREPIREHIRFFKETIAITDTPGVRRQKAVSEDLESLMVKTALQAVRRADIVLLLLDASSGRVSDQELKLAYYVFESQYKALILLFNKQDLVTQESVADMKMSMSEHEQLLRRVEQLSISCQTGKNIGAIMPLVHKVWQRHTSQFSSSDLTALCTGALAITPLYKNGKILVVYEARQIKMAPITISLRVNIPAAFGSSQLAFFENKIRKAYALTGVPIRLLVR